MSNRTTTSEPAQSRQSLQPSILADCALPEELQVSQSPVRAPRVILVTGATGFVGGHLLRELLAIEDVVLFCLVRAESEAAAAARLEHSLATVGLSHAAFKTRLHVVRGAVTEPRFGLSAARYDEIAGHIEAVYHCAAEVNWTRSYRQLRHTNVGGTLEALRFAFHRRAKAFTFVSTISVGFTSGGPTVVAEHSDMLPWLHHMPLGYAQTKCVAEELLHVAAARGLPVTIVRASLLAGDTTTGAAVPNDLIAALLEACVKHGAALDIDWLFECIPVDYAARSIVALSRANRGELEIYHLRAQQPRHWREIILWLNLLGYPVRLEPVEAWLDRMFGHRLDQPGRLYPFRRFFKGLPGTKPNFRPFEIFLEGQRRVNCDATEATLANLGIDEPLLNADLLNRCVRYFVSIDVLPRLPRARPLLRRDADNNLRAAIETSLRRQRADPDLRIEGWKQVAFDSAGGLMNEIASVRLGASVGIRRFHITCSTANANSAVHLGILVKTKAEDTVMDDLLIEVACLCDPAVGRQFRRFKQVSGLARSHLRELAIYATSDQRIARHLPHCYGVAHNGDERVWSLAMEALVDVDLLDCANTPGRWTAVHIRQAIVAAARMHSVWHERERELRAQPWIAAEIAPREAQAMQPLWQALLGFSDTYMAEWAGSSLRPTFGHLIECIGDWWAELAAMPQTLIHNDFNPRNLAFRRTSGLPELCAFDWELARIGVPQHDLAEFLCFVLPQETDVDQVSAWIDLHRCELAANTGNGIDPELWSRGFLLSLQRFAIERLPLYCIAHRFKPQRFLPRVVANWVQLHQFGQQLAVNPPPGVSRLSAFPKIQKRA